MKSFALFISILSSVSVADATTPPASTNRYFQETFGNNYVVKVFLDDFDKLSLQDKELSYHFNEFSKATRDLSFIQAHPQGLEIRNFVEDLYTSYKVLKAEKNFNPSVLTAIEEYLKTYYLWHGPYVWGGQNKIVMNLTDKKLRRAVRLVESKSGAVTEEQLDKYVKTILDPDHESYAKGPNGELGTQTFYQAGLRLDEIREFRETKYPHRYTPGNSYLSRGKDGKIEESFFRTGGKDLLLPPAMPEQAQFDKYQTEISDLEAVMKKEGLSVAEVEGYEKQKAKLEEKRDRLYFEWVELILDAYLKGKSGVFVKGDVEEGLYAKELKKGMPHLQAAIDLLPMGYDKASLEFTKRALESADSNAVYVYAAAIAANKSTGAVRLAAGFGDNYSDPLGHTSNWTSWVFQTIKSDLVKQVTEPATILALQSSIPWDRQFDNPKPVANTTLIDWQLSVGGLCPACPGGFNTADDHLGRFAPSLSTIVVNWTTARSQGAPPGAAGEFFLKKDDRDRMDKSLPEMGKLAIVLHESLGHAIGMRKPNFAVDISPHGQMLEEARAEGAAAYFMGDPEVMKIAGINDDDLKVYYLDFVTDAMLITLNRIPEGDTEYRRPHERAFNLISRYLVAGNYGIKVTNDKGDAWKSGDKVYFEVTDTAKVREGLGKLLAELMQAIGKGDKTKADELDSKYGGVHDSTWMKQAQTRAAAVGYKPQWVGLLPELKAVEKAGKIEDVTVWHDDSFLKQQLRFSGKTLP
jgi:hypothetical protein